MKSIDSIYKNFIQSGHQFSDNEILLKFQFKILNMMLLVTTVFSFVFATLSFLGVNDIGMIHASMNYILSALVLFLLFKLRTSKSLYNKISYFAYTFTFINFVSALFFVPGDEFRIIWFYLLIMAVYINGHFKIANIISILSIIIILLANIFYELHISENAIFTSTIGIFILSLMMRSYSKKIYDLDNEVLKHHSYTVENLEHIIEEEIEKRKKHEHLFMEQSRQAQMGEMISMIAHQWRQPLASISATSIDMQIKIELDKFDLNDEDKKYFTNSCSQIDLLVHTLTTTIDDFRNFHKQDKTLVEITFEEIVNKSLNIIKASLNSDNVNISTEFKTDKKIQMFDNEMTQVILNILKNSQDNFQEKKTQDPYIKIVTEDNTISISDNGGGIENDILNKIFDPYFSTKSKKNGTGLGLYMSKIIVEEHLGGKLRVTNTEEGVCFKIEI
ncbi:HAMP domain-containing histidine kinase [Sulfurimonas sp.]|nr:HAMP domain-containing histidine kinase [Sulfurimonas sp.]